MDPTKAVAPTLRETTAIGIPTATQTASVQVLNRTLANLSVLLTKTKKCHWDVGVPHFIALHRLLDDQYTKLEARVDEAAERIRMLGAFPVGTLLGFLSLTDLQARPSAVPTATEVVRLLLNDHELMARNLRDPIRDAQEYDAGTADLLTQILRDHEKMAWILRAFVHGENIHPIRGGDLPRD
jgi:starvation-inducible DNA-binding protein